MTKELKPGDTLQHEGRKWTVSEISEDNEGDVVYHLKLGDEVSVVKQSVLPNEGPARGHKAPRSGGK
jgi:hypothetical protein